MTPVLPFALAALLLATCCGNPARAQGGAPVEGAMLAEDAAAYLIAFRDPAIFRARATIALDPQMVGDLGLVAELHKVGPGSFIAAHRNGNGFFGTSIRRVGRCRFEERYTQVAVAGAPKSPAGETDSNAPDKTYDFTDAVFAVAGRESLAVRGPRVFCAANLCVDQTELRDVTPTPDAAARARKAEELVRVIAQFRREVCPGRQP